MQHRGCWSLFLNCIHAPGLPNLAGRAVVITTSRKWVGRVKSVGGNRFVTLWTEVFQTPANKSCQVGVCVSEVSAQYLTGLSAIIE